MKLSKHQKKIVDAIISGKVYDIPSYLREFEKCHIRKYDLTQPLEKFAKEQDGKKYKVIIDEEKTCIKGVSPMNLGFGTINVETKLPKKAEDIPDDAWEYQDAQLIRNIKPIEFEYNDQSFSYDFTEIGVSVADNFEDIIEFMNLWTYLHQESLVLEVPRDITADDFGILFELKHKEPKKETPFIIHKDKASDSSIKPISRVTIDYGDFYPCAPIFLLSSYMDSVWEINKEHLKNCEEYIGRKILPTKKLSIFAKQLYITAGEWRYRIPLIISIIALVVSILPTIQSLIPSDKPDYIKHISQDIEEIEEMFSKANSNSDIQLELKRIEQELTAISTSLDKITDQSTLNAINNLAEQIEQLNASLEQETTSD